MTTYSDNCTVFPLTVTVNKQSLYNNICSAIISRTPTVELSEVDYSWYALAVDAVFYDVASMLRPLTDTEKPLTVDRDVVEISLNCVHELQSQQIAGAIDRYLIDSLTFKWFYDNPRPDSVVPDPVRAYDNLRHVVLMNNGVSRKNRF